MYCAGLKKKKQKKPGTFLCGSKVVARILPPERRNSRCWGNPKEAVCSFSHLSTTPVSLFYYRRVLLPQRYEVPTVSLLGRQPRHRRPSAAAPSGPGPTVHWAGSDASLRAGERGSDRARRGGAAHLLPAFKSFRAGKEPIGVPAHTSSSSSSSDGSRVEIGVTIWIKIPFYEFTLNIISKWLYIHIYIQHMHFGFYNFFPFKCIYI